MIGTMTSASTEVGPWHPTDPGNQHNWQAWHLYVSGSLGGGTVEVEVSPDPDYIADANKRWFGLSQGLSSGTFITTGTISSLPYSMWFNARARAFRAILSGATTATASVILEIV